MLVTQKFSQIDLHPETVSNVEMGLIFEELIRKFAEASNETAGEHFTPRDVVRLIVNLLFATDDEILSKPGVVRSVYDPTAGTGGMLSVADDYIRNLNPEASLTLFGQELNGESYAIAKADMVIKGQDIENMVWGDTLTNDGHHGKYFDYCLANPPFGVEWKKQQAFVEREHRDRGFDGRLEKKTEIRESLAELQSPLGGGDIRASNLWENPFTISFTFIIANNTPGGYIHGRITGSENHGKSRPRNAPRSPFGC